MSSNVNHSSAHTDGGGGHLYGGLERIIASVSEDMPLSERLDWLVRGISWLRQHQDQFAHPQYFFEILDGHPRAKARCARALRSILREVGAVDFLFDVQCLQRPPSDVNENDFVHVIRSIFTKESDLIWFSHLNPDTVQLLVSLLHFEISPTERKWNRLNEDVRQALVLLGSRVRLTAREWSKMQKQDRNEIFDQTPYARIGLLIDHLIIAKNEREAKESPLLAQELYLLIRQCRRMMDETRQRLLTGSSSQREVEHAELLFRQLTRLKTLINIYTHRPTFVREAVKLTLPLIESFMEGAPRVGLLTRAVFAVRDAEKISEMMMNHSRYRPWKKAGGFSAVFGGFAFAVATGLSLAAERSQLEVMPKLGLQFLALTLGFFVATKFNLKFFSEVLPWDLSQIGKGIRKVAGRRTASNDFAILVADTVKSQASVFAVNLVGLTPAMFWVSLTFYIFAHHSILDKDEALRVSGLFSNYSSMIVGGILTGALWFVSILSASRLQSTLNPARSAIGIKDQIKNGFLDSAIHIVTASTFVGLYLSVSLGLKVAGVDLAMNHIILDVGVWILSLGTAGGAIIAAKLFWSSLFGLLMLAVSNLIGSYGLAYAFSLVGQARRPAINLRFLQTFFAQLKPAGGIVATRAGVEVPEVRGYDPTQKAPEWMSGGGQVKTRGSSLHPGAPNAEAPVQSAATSAGSYEKTELMAPVHPQLQPQPHAHAEPNVIELSAHMMEVTDPGLSLERTEVVPSANRDAQEKTEVMPRSNSNSYEKTEVVSRSYEKIEVVSPAHRIANEKTEVMSSASNERTEVVGLHEVNEVTDPGLRKFQPIELEKELSAYGAPDDASAAGEKTEVMSKSGPNQKRRV